MYFLTIAASYALVMLIYVQSIVKKTNFDKLGCALDEEN